MAVTATNCRYKVRKINKVGVFKSMGSGWVGVKGAYCSACGGKRGMRYARALPIVRGGEIIVIDILLYTIVIYDSRAYQ